MKVFNPFFKISGQKIIFINLNNFFGYCSFWECTCMGTAGMLYLGIG
jgi:hypothetical protein